MTIISSQRYLDDDTVQEKRDAGDYAVTVSPEFEVCGEMVRVLIDGHHSYAAAIADGVKPEITEADTLQDGRIGLLPDADAYLESSYMGDAWYDISTGRIGLLPDADAYLESSYMGDAWYDISTGRTYF